MTPEERCIWHQAQRCLGRLGQNVLWSLEDLISEGHVCLCKAKKTWRPDGGAKFNTYFTTILMLHYGKIVNQALRQAKTTSLDVEVKDDPSAIWSGSKGKIHYWLNHFQLSKDAEGFLWLVFTPPPALRRKLEKSRQHSIAAVVREWLGWPREKLAEVEAELHKAVIL